MNNEQLGLLLKNYEALLRFAIEEVRQNLPDEFLQTTYAYGNPTKSYPILEPVVALADRLCDDAERMFSSS